MDKKIIIRSAFMRAATDELIKNRQAEFVISSEAVDTYNTVFKMDGWDLKRYAKNPIVCFQHRSSSEDPDNVIGTSEIFIEDGKLIGRVTFEDAETNPKAEKIMRKVHNNTLQMASISAMPLDARMGVKSNDEDPEVLYFTRQELVEWSIVTVGSNPDALKRNAIAVDEIRTEMAKSIDVNKQKKVNKRSVVEAQILINKNKQNV